MGIGHWNRWRKNAQAACHEARPQRLRKQLDSVPRYRAHTVAMDETSQTGQVDKAAGKMKFACPTCGHSSRAIKAITARSLLTEAARAHLTNYDGFRFCPTDSCPLVYFRPEDGLRFGADSVRVTVFQKSECQDRLVCYCFDHSVLSINQEVKRDGSSSAIESITEKCRNGEDRCPETNPQGSCCLGNVRAVVKAAQE